MRNILKIGIACALLSSYLVFAVEVEHFEGFHIQSISTESNLGTGVTKYIGNVVITRGNTRFEADRITEYRMNKRLIRIVAEGNPATYTDDEADNSDIVYGIAKRVEYVVRDGKIFLTEFELRDRDGNTSKAENGSYILDDG